MVASQAGSTDRPHDSPSADEEVMRLFMQHQPMLFVFLQTLLNDYADAEEVLQETSIVIWRKRQQFVPGTSFANWAMTVAQLEARKFLRTRKQLPRAFNDELVDQLAAEMVAEHDLIESRHRALRYCLENLKDNERHLVDVAYGVDLTMKVISEQLGMIPSRFYKTLNRIRQRLQKCIQYRLAAEGRS
jgi:RNA polymerase sigma-70 factor, ECF subfamily